MEARIAKRSLRNVRSISTHGDEDGAVEKPGAGPALPSVLPSLDGVRGIAILLVLVHQFGTLENPAGFAVYIFANVITLGWAGVQLFFVLSGFLITGILLDTRRSDNYYSSFFARRTLRIFPLYYGVLVVAYLVLPSIGVTVSRIEEDRFNQI